MWGVSYRQWILPAVRVPINGQMGLRANGREGKSRKEMLETVTAPHTCFLSLGMERQILYQTHWVAQKVPFPCWSPALFLTPPSVLPGHWQQLCASPGCHSLPPLAHRPHRTRVIFLKHRLRLFSPTGTPFELHCPSGNRWATLPASLESWWPPNASSCHSSRSQHCIPWTSHVAIHSQTFLG